MNNRPIQVLEPMRPDLSAARVAGMLAVDERTVRRMVARGEMPAFRIGRQLRFAMKDVNDYLRAARIDRKA